MKKNKKYISLSLVLAVVMIANILVFPKAFAASKTVNITLTKYSQIIPEDATSDLVYHGQILYLVTVKAVVKNTSGNPISGQTVSFSNPNSSTVSLFNTSGATNSSGVAYAYYEVRGTTTFSCTASVSNSNYSGSKASQITPSEECEYLCSFYITCYNTASESDFSGTKISVSGISGYTFRKNFIAAVKLNGSGYSSTNGIYIRYTGNDTYTIGTPLTSTGTTPTVGRTIAVDNYYIPRYNNSGTYLRGCVNIENIGNRRAEDSGSAIDEYHIDVYVGDGMTPVNNFQYSGESKLVTYLGNNKNLW